MATNPHAVPNKPGDNRLRCPNDGTFMEKIPVGKASKLEVEHCARCGCMWFDPYELAQAIESRAAVNEIDYGVAKKYDQDVLNPLPKHCPRDQTPLVSIPDPRQPHVVIDVCRDCGGVLLDAGELKDLSEFTVGERLKAFFKR
jgi:Zn-finger nucleic acid-binding protein